jgi:hypothetical protein
VLAWDVRRAKIFGCCDSTTGIVPFDGLVQQVMSQEPYRGAKRVFWIVDNGSSHRGQASSEQPGDVALEEEPASVGDEQESGTKSKKPRTYTSLKVVEIALTSKPLPFADFANEKQPGDTTKKFLVCAAWLKENRNIAVVDAHHIWTCFRHVGWGVQRDMAQPLRDGSRKGYYKKVGKGKYEITHLGLDAVNKMKGAVQHT